MIELLLICHSTFLMMISILIPYIQMLSKEVVFNEVRISHYNKKITKIICYLFVAIL